MPSKKSDKTPFDSKFDAHNGERGITPAYRLIEIIFQRRAEKDNEGALPRKFWALQKYKWSVFKERNIAYKLLEQYDIAVIVKALESKKGSNILSLGNKRLAALVKHEESISKQQELIPTEVETSGTKKPFGKKNLWSQL